MRLSDAIASVLDQVPPGFRSDTVVFAVEPSHPDRLRGLYEGVPLTARADGRPYPPSVITLFLDQLQGLTVDHVRAVVIHELGHHFGLTDGELATLGR